jgi:hypothetical protein
MARPRILDEKLLKKIVKKKNNGSNVLSVTKLVSSRARRSHVSSPVALILTARDHQIGTSTYENTLTDAQKAELRSIITSQSSQNFVSAPKRPSPESKKISILIDYDTDDYFKSGHVTELNRAYTYGCYTVAFTLGRKIVENLIIDILKTKYPESNKKNKELYFDTVQGRLKDFSVILNNLKAKKSDFGTENKGVERLCSLAKSLKDHANDKTHSWYHLVKNKSEIDNLQLQMIIEIIKKLEKIVGIRT